MTRERKWTACNAVSRASSSSLKTFHVVLYIMASAGIVSPESVCSKYVGHGILLSCANKAVEEAGILLQDCSSCCPSSRRVGWRKGRRLIYLCIKSAVFLSIHRARACEFMSRAGRFSS